MLRRFPLAILLALSAARLAAAAEPAAEPAPGDVFAGRVDVEVGEVEVHVTGTDGAPIEGLRAEDFRLLLDGRPVPITGFHAAGTADGDAGAPAPPGGNGSTPHLPSPADPAPGEPTLLAVYLDESNLLPQGRRTLFAALGDFVDRRVGPGRPAMVLRFRRSLDVALPPTDDPAAVRAALAELGRNATDLPASLRDEQSALTEIRAWYDAPGLGPGKKTASLGGGVAEGCDPEKLTRMHRVVERVAEAREAEVLAALGASLRAVRVLGALPGRRVLLYVADQIPHRPGHRLHEYLRELCPPSVTDTRMLEHADGRIATLLSRLAEEAAAAGVTIHAFQPSGLHLPGPADASVETRTGGAAVATARWDAEDSLFTLADTTGGRAFLHRGDLAGALADVERDLDVYYSLAFDAAALGDRGVHRVAVELARPGMGGARLRHRGRLRVESPEERARGDLLAALAGGGDVFADGLGASVQVGRVAELERKRYEVSLWLRLPVAALVFVPDGEDELAQLSLTLTAEDHRGRRTPTQAIVVPVRLPHRQLAAKRDGDFLYELKTMMRPGRHVLALRVEDTSGGATETLDVEVTVPPEG